MKKRFLFTLMALCLCLCLLPTAAVAEETCAHETCDEETGICTTPGCGYQYPVDADGVWYKSIDDVPFDNGVMGVWLYDDTGSGKTISPVGYDDVEELTIDLAGHTLKSDISATTASKPPVAICIMSQNDLWSTVAGTFDGSITVDLGNTGLTIANDVTVTGKVTINGAEGLGRSVWLNKGAIFAGGIKLNVPGRTLKDCLPDNTAYADATTGVLVDGNVTEITGAVKVVVHTSHTFTDGKCGCGAKRVATVTINGATTYLADLSGINTLIDGKTATVDLLADASGDISVSSGTITLDLNGKTLTGGLTVSGGNVTVNANGGKITGNVSLTNGYLTLNGGTYNGTVTASGGTLYITGGTFNGTVDLGSAGTATLTGGTFTKLKAGSDLKTYLAANCAFVEAENPSKGVHDPGTEVSNVKVIAHYGHTVANGNCTICGKSLAASITNDSETQYFETLEDALTNAADNSTVTLENEITLTRDISLSGKSITLDLNGKTIRGSGNINVASGATLTLKGTEGSEIAAPINVNGTLNVAEAVVLQGVSVTGHIAVDADAKFVSLSITGGTATLNSGTFTTLEVGSSETLSDKIAQGSITLGTDKALRSGSNWYTGDGLNTQSLSDVSVKEIPIKSVTISGKTSFAYGEDVVLTANVTRADGVTAEPTYKWENAGSTGQNLGSTQTITLNDLAPSSQKYNIMCTVTVDGYSLSENIEFTVSKATLTSKYTAPTAKTLTYTGFDQVLVNAGSFGKDVTTGSNGPKFQYGMENANGVMEWGDASGRTGRDAGTYTVYWYIDGGTNYESVGSEEKPADTLTVTIGKAAPTAADFTFTPPTSLTYDGTAKTATVTPAEGITGMGKITVKYFKGNEEVTEAKDAGTYTVKISVAEGGNYSATTTDLTNNWTFAIAKANYTGAKTASGTVTSNQAATGKTLTLPTLPDGAFYGEPTYSGDLIGAASVSGTTLTYDVTSRTADTTGTITVPVTGATNYNDYNVTVTITAMDKTAVTISGLTAAADLIYDGTARTGYTGTASFSPTWSGTLTATYYLSDGTTKTTAANSGAASDGAAPVNAGDYKVVLAIPNSDETYTGSTTIDFTIGKKPIGGENNHTIVTLGPALTYNGTSQTQTVDKVELDGEDITAFCTIDGTTQTNAGSNYMLWVTAKDGSNYRGMMGKEFTIAPKPITVSSAAVSDKDYDGTTAAAVTAVSFDGLVNSETLELGTDYEVVSAAFPDADADTSDVNVTMTVRLKDTDKAKNYSLSSGNFMAANAAKINKIELPDSEKPAELSSLSGAKGNKLSTVILPNGWTWAAPETVMGTTGNQTFNANYAGSTNYKAKDNVALTVNVVNKTDVSGSITFVNGSLTYTGSALAFETATITGVSGGTWTYTYAANTDTGATLSGGKPLTVGTYTVTATYEDAANLGTATATLTVTKATPTGAPKYTAITTGGKKLSDAALTVNESWPAGTVQWVQDDGVTALADTTEVTANTAYKWIFTPTDSGNYNAINGSITLWHRSSGGSSAPVTPPTVTVPVSSDHATVEVKAEVSKGNATVEVSDKQIEQVANNGAGSVTVDVSGLKNVDSATVPSHVVEKTNEAENTGLTVALPAGSVTLDETALESVTESADGKDVTISVVAVPTTILPPAVKDIVGMEPTVAAVVDVNITVGSTKQSSFNGGKVTVSIPYTPKKGEDTSKLTVWFIRDDGTIENKGGYYDAVKKCFVFETEHLSQYLLVSAPVTFVDVPVNAYFYNAVAWAVDNGITGGTTSTTFSPYASCTRAQLVTFLYRYVQSQGGGFTGAWMFQLPFSDVPEWCYESVAWCYMNNIVGGYGNGLFGSNDTITREQMAVILYRFAQKTGLDTTQGGMAVREYSDYESISDYAVTAMQWAVNAGILQGHNNNLMPGQPCTRAQIVTMLYRLLGN